MIDFNKIVFILGTPRSGKKVIKCLLDNHPDLLVWPEEFPFFALYNQQKQLDNNNYISNLNKIIVSSMMKRSYPKTNQNSIKLGTRPFFGNLDVSLFADLLYKYESSKMDSLSYLSLLFNAFHKANTKYSRLKVKNYIITCSGQGFDWSKESLLRNSQFIWPYRDIYSTYASWREKVLNGKKINLYQFLNTKIRKGSFYQISLLCHLSKRLEENSKRSNFLIIKLKDIQKNTCDSIKTISRFLSIKHSSTLNEQTICGDIYPGNSHEKSLRKGRIISRSSKIKTPLTTFEKKIIDLSEIQGDSLRLVKNNSISLLKLIKIAFNSAFFDKLNNHSLVLRSLIFFRFIILFISIKNKFISSFSQKKLMDFYLSLAKN